MHWRPSLSVCLLGSFACLSAASLLAQEKSDAKKEERPSMAAIAASNTVLHADVAYGADAKQRLDVYSPRGAKDASVVIFVHGGEWTKGDKAEVSYKPKFLNENGVV